MNRLGRLKLKCQFRLPPFGHLFQLRPLIKDDPFVLRCAGTVHIEIEAEIVHIGRVGLCIGK